MKIILIFIFSIFVLSARDNENNLRSQILHKVCTEISINKKLKVWSDNKDVLFHLKKYDELNTVDSCEKASFIILQDSNKLSKACESKHIFVLDYNLLSVVPKSFGAFFWKKGRPNIVIIEPRIKAQSIKISTALQEYLEEKVW
jgi:hypothetical protein